MAEEKLQFVLELATRATGDGARRTADDMERVRTAIGASTEKAKVSQFAYYDLDAEMRKTGGATQTLTSGLTKLAPTTRNNAQALLMFSQGFEDAQYGIRGVLNNIPSLIMTLGGGAGLAGAISIAAVAGSTLYSMLSGVEEKSSDVADRIKQIADNMADSETDRFEAEGKSIEAAALAKAAMKQGWEEAKQAEAAFSLVALSNAEKLKQAQILIVEALGYQVDKFWELEDIASREEQKRNITAQQAIANENERLKKSREAVTVAADEAQAQSYRALNLQANLQRAQAELQVLREKRDELKKIAALAAGGLNFTGMGDAVSPDAARNFEVGSAARSALDSKVFQSKLAGTEARVNRLEELVRSFDDEGTGIVAKAEMALLAAQKKSADVASAVETNISSIQKTLEADETLARTQYLADTSKAFVGQIEQSVALIETTNEAGKKSLERTKTALSDGALSAQESVNLSRDLATLIDLLRTGQASSKQSVQTMINLQTTNNTEMTRLNAELLRLKSSIEQSQGR